MNWQDYEYFLPKKNLALKPASPRHLSKLFVYQTKTNEIFFDRFLNIDKYLTSDNFLVLNNTKVLPAKVSLKKENGGQVKVLFLVNEINKKSKKMIKALFDRKVNLGVKLFFDDKNYLLVVKQKEKIFYLKPYFSWNKFLNLLKIYGEAPIPLYLRQTPLSKDKLLKSYQTIFAQKLGSVAAPTASLHFSNQVFKKLAKKNIERYFLTLHVGLGTFSPVTEANLRQKKLHREYYQVEKKVWQKILEQKEQGKKLVAVGTTVVRTLETLAKNPKRKNFFGQTSLFIFPPFNFQMVDHLITNFHLPKSSLMMLVEAFLRFKKAKRSLIELYNIAIKNNFRFYSFGDAMLII